ncbi:DISARM system phospholipase D-like protein DrmC [Kitasatospora cinereorecta]|uniref:DISARM system phospholipase D-like protein DrmC n=1 Tax=Kitasatospora cinereorecta TaxID=285560 RepID=A0ABW0V949_9ACTN
MTQSPAVIQGDGFQAAAEALLVRLGPAAVRQLADRIERGHEPAVILHSLSPHETDPVRRMLNAKATEQTSDPIAATYLRGLAAGYARQEARCEVEVVWSGPTTHQVPVRATEQVLLSLIGSAVKELLLMTYSAKPHPPVLDALNGAGGRGVAMTIVVETLQGAGSAISGPEPAAAFSGITGLELWHWPVEKRTQPGAKQHAKLAIADTNLLFVTSANLTASGISKSIEAGLLVRGGSAPRRAAEHIRALRSNGTLAKLF